MEEHFIFNFTSVNYKPAVLAKFVPRFKTSICGKARNGKLYLTGEYKLKAGDHIYVYVTAKQ